MNTTPKTSPASFFYEDQQWRSIPGLVGLYEVSSYGHVLSLPRVVVYARLSKQIQKSVAGKMLKPQRNANGYLAVRLYSGGGGHTFDVHRLVAHAFLPSPPGPVGPGLDQWQVNHRDGDKLNNRLSNLEWVTGRTNMDHAVMLQLHARGIHNANAKLTPEKVRDIRSHYATGRFSQPQLARLFKVSNATIHCIVTQKTWRHV